MASDSKLEALLAASKAPAFKKVKRVPPEQSPETPAEKAPDPELGHAMISKERYTSPEFMKLEWEKIWSKVWLLGGLESDIRRARRLHLDGDRPRVGADRPAAGRQGARVLQCLPASRQSAAPDGRRQRADVQVPVPPLGIRSRRRVQAHPGPRHLPAGRTALSRARRAAVRHLGQLRVVQPGPASRPAARVPRPDAAPPRSVQFPQDGAHARHHRRVELQLEGVGRRVQRELPRAGHPPAADVVPARPRHPDRLLRPAHAVPDPVRHLEPARPPAARHSGPDQGDHEGRRHGSGRLRRAVREHPPRRAAVQAQARSGAGQGLFAAERRPAHRRLPLPDLPERLAERARGRPDAVPPAAAPDRPGQDVLRHLDARAGAGRQGVARSGRSTSISGTATSRSAWCSTRTPPTCRACRPACTRRRSRACGSDRRNCASATSTRCIDDYVYGPGGKPPGAI